MGDGRRLSAEIRGILTDARTYCRILTDVFVIF
jgi:hypothetical protein